MGFKRKSKAKPGLSKVQAKAVKQIIKKEDAKETEYKYVDVLRDAVDSTMITLAANVPQIFLLNGCTQGTSAATRIGNKVKPQLLDIDIDLLTNLNNVADQEFRFGIIYDRNPNATTPSYSGTQVTSIYDDLAVGTSFLNMKPLQMTQPRFVFLKDEHVVAKLANLTTTTTINAQISKHYRIKLGRKPMSIYSGTGSTVSSLVEGAYWFVILSNQAGFCKFNSRWFYSDE